MHCACAPSVFDENAQAFAEVGLEKLDILQQREHADDDDNDADDLLRAAVNRQHVNEIKNQNNDKKCNENADQQAHGLAPLSIASRQLARPDNIIAWGTKSSSPGTAYQPITG
jgi:hypothetical protein